MNPVRLLAGAALALLPCPGTAQSGGMTLPHAHRAADALRRIVDEYVDVVKQETLVDRCIDGTVAWLAAQKQPVAAPAPDPVPEKRIGALFSAAAERYPDLDASKLADACLARVVESLDKHSQYMDRDSFRELMHRGGGGAGIGIEIKGEGEYVGIVAALEGTPAARSDLAKGDLIVSVNGAPARGLKLVEVVRLLRGEPGSALVLELQRAGTPGTLRREFKREIIRIPPVRMAPLDGGLVYLRIAQFGDALRDRFPQALREAAAKTPGGLTGVIIDLRNNAGGVLSSCIAVAAAFLPRTAMIVELRGRTESNSRRMFARHEDIDQERNYRAPQLPEPLHSLPLVVLVNGNTAACSEILAAAMQDHARGKVVGEKTFGAGTVQTILPIGSETALRLTTARYYRPGGAAMEGNPVIPDVEVAAGEDALSFGGVTDPALPVARSLLLRK